MLLAKLFPRPRWGRGGAIRVAQPAVLRRTRGGRRQPHPDPVEPLERRVLLAAAGDLDPSFGDGGKSVVTGAVDSDFNAPFFLARQSSAKTIVATITATGAPAGVQLFDYAVFRLNRDGSLDTSFGDGGVVTRSPLDDHQMLGVIVQPDQKVLFYGRSFGDGSTFHLFRYTAEGEVDNSFGGDGVVSVQPGAGVDFVNAVALQPNGDIVVGGQADASGAFALTRLNGDGSPDTGFGDGGVAIVFLGESANLQALAVDSNNRVLAAGSVDRQVTAVRLTTGGALDAGYGDDGVARAPTATVGLWVVDSALQPDGKFLLKAADRESQLAPALIRFTTGGDLDPAFGGGNGVASANVAGGGDSAAAPGLAVAPDGAIVTIDSASVGEDQDDLIVARFTPAGGPDTKFGGGDGSVVVNFGDGAEAPEDVVIHADGRIVAVARIRDLSNGASTPAFVRLLTDATPPTASVTPPAIVAGTASSTFQVQYGDNVAVDPNSISADDVAVLDPTGAALAVSLQGVTGGATPTATFRVAAPGGTWDAADGGTYTIEVKAGGVADTSGNVNAAATAQFAFVGADPDTEAPDAALDANPAPVPGSQSYDFSVTYTDNVLVVVEGSANDVVVTGPNGFVEFATFVGIMPGGTATSKRVTYRINAPGGAFDTADNGSYTVETFELSTVTDGSGNRVRLKAAGTFSVGLGIGPSATVLGGQPAPIFSAATYDFAVTYEDSSLVDAATIDGADIVITGPNGFSAAATPVSFNANAAPINTAVYRVAAPGGSFGPEDNGAYTINLQTGAVADTDGNAAPGGAVGTFNVALSAPVPGGLDPTFGGGTGVVTFDPPGPPVKTTDVIAEPDGGSTAVAFTVATPGSADVTLFRVTFGGALDPAFGGSGNGLVSLDIGADDRPTSLVRLADGKLLVAGTTSTYDGAGVETDADFFVARFNADGTLDTTFGATGGFTVADFGPASFDRANDQVVAPDGRIYLFGQSTGSDPNGDFAFARFDASGAFDPSFGVGGRVVTDLGGADVANAVTIDASGRFVAAGSTSSGFTGSFAVVRYNADGSIDNSFGPTGNGRNFVDFRPGFDEAQGIVRQDDGRLVAGGLATTGDPDDPGFDSDFAVARFDADGNLDAGFGSGGMVLTDFAGQLASINKLIFQPGNKIIAAGQVVNTLAGVGVENVQVAIARFNADGSPDATFSDDGKLVVDFTVLSGSSAGTFNAVGSASGTSLSGGAAGTELEQKFEQFRLESQGLVSLTRGGAILLLATQGPIVEIARIVGDAGAPSLFVALIANITEIDVTAATFVVRYVDDQSIDVTRLGTGDIRVTGPNGFSQLAEFVELVDGNANAPERTVRYRVKPGGAAFLKADEGSYALSVEPNRVADIHGNALPGGPIPNAVFTITIPENLANLRVDGGLTGKFPAAVVGGARASGGTVRVTNSGELNAKTTVAVTIFASPDAAFDEGADTPIVTINGVKISLKPGKAKAIKLKFTRFPSGLPDGDYFLIARIDSAGALAELKESDNVAPTAAPINIAAPFVDLAGTAGAIKGALVPGGKANGSILVSNGGNSAVKQTTAAAILASLDGAVVGNDTAVGSAALKLNLKAARAKSSKLSFTLPAGLAPGSYTLLAVLDDPSVIAESNEANNVVVLGTFTV